MLKAVLFDFNGIIINDEPLHEKLIDELLLEENLRPKPGEFRQFCLGRSDRACLIDLLQHRGRVITEEYASKLIARKSMAYQSAIKNLETLPIYPDLQDFIFKLRVAKVKMAIVSGALLAEIELVLKRAQLSDYFSVIIAADQRLPSKPEPNSYLLAVDRLNQADPTLNLKPSECLAIEDTFAGIEAAKRARIPVVGVANTYPFHMLQRRANWAVDRLSDLEFDRVQRAYDSVAAKAG
ncbi:HAD family phosphatase [Leptolyngbya sp. FACHB-321]|uniref:HAD family hydrolase n=1 Tax=Leptolyngbya sp. FACHB-321 TaxID=2692807 RepID=UPI001686FCCA|nr:HAD family phosphatase [Leptolyngbya sp. FACHB-321]MBD2036283.1 HAD family phosphatase [Leptolyngbya sp. FACHB-321]